MIELMIGLMIELTTVFYARRLRRVERGREDRDGSRSVLGVRDADHRDLPHRGVERERLFDLVGVDVDPARDDEIIGASDDVDATNRAPLAP